MQTKVGVPVELSLETYQMSEGAGFHPFLLANLAVEEKHFVPQLLVVQVDDLIAMT